MRLYIFISRFSMCVFKNNRNSFDYIYYSNRCKHTITFFIYFIYIYLHMQGFLHQNSLMRILRTWSFFNYFLTITWSSRFMFHSIVETRYNHLTSNILPLFFGLQKTIIGWSEDASTLVLNKANEMFNGKEMDLLSFETSGRFSRSSMVHATASKEKHSETAAIQKLAKAVSKLACKK